MATPNSAPTREEDVAREEAADRSLAAIFRSSRSSEECDIRRVVSILLENPKLAHRSYETVYPNAKISPLFCILTFGADSNLEVIRTVYELNPSALETPQGRNKDTALHFACQHGAPPAVVEFIYSKYPAALSTLNGSGRPAMESLLPRLKCKQSSGLMTLNVLLMAAPQAILVRNGRGQNLLETALNLGGWSSAKALVTLAERYWQQQNGNEETLLELLLKVDKARRLRPAAKQSIRCALLGFDPSTWAGQ